MKIKINKWEDLDGKVGDFNLRTTATQMIVYNSNLYVSQLFTNNCSKEVSLAWLKVFGFDVEFETQIKLTDREINQLKVFGDGWLARDECRRLYWFEAKPDKSDSYWHNTYSFKTCEVLEDLFEFITWESDCFRVSELLELERA